ncbi:transferase [Coraliomargarita sinensis]|uniref:Transferase n=1 Tax=Coraliomargarita sinensis TaxID=2174842 RepID=A0A317ZK80_9BACT|nr:glycosyltransferase [Coraliomargarita sinensis]PXA04219.1 transferase [Coraliomargarita sinensis]
MKILRVIHSVQAKSGGPVEGLKQAAKVMSELGVELEIACLDAPEAIEQELEEFIWPLHALGPGKLGNYAYTSKMKAWLEHNVPRFDAVIIHGNWQYHGLAASRSCRRHKVPYFIYPHGMLDPWFNETYPLKKVKKRLYWNIGEHPVLHHAKAVLFTCQEECLRARRCFAPYHVNEKVIGYGTNTPEYDIDSLQASRPHEAPYFLFMSRIQEKKGLDLLVEAYCKLRKELPDLPDLVIAGPEQQPEYAENLKTNYPQNRIHWLSEVRGLDKWKLLANAEALVLPSHQENFGIVVAEALATGTPALISDKVNIHTEVAQYGAGFVEPDDLSGTTRLLKRWHALSSSEKDRMATAAKSLFNKHFDIRQASEDLIQYIQESIQSDERAPAR